MSVKIKWNFGEPYDKLEKEIDEIMGDMTESRLLGELPASLPYNEAQDAKLVVKKLGDMVWQVSYEVYKTPKTKDFEQISIMCFTQPSLRLALFEMYKELNK